MNLTGWFSIKEMTKLNTATLTWKLLNMKNPTKLSLKLQHDTQNMKIEITEIRIQFTRQNFMYRARNEWNSIPDYIRMNGNLGSLKKQMKSWIKERRDREPD